MNLLSLLELIVSSKNTAGGKLVTGESNDQIRRLQSASDTLLSQATLICELANIEWRQEKQRIAKMLSIGVLVFASLVCLMLTAGMIVMAIAWDTPYRLMTATGIFIVYGICGAASYILLQRVSARSSDVFSATRDEIAANITLIKSTLWP